MRRKAPSLVGRAVAALLLTIAFYGLAVIIAVTVLAIPVLGLIYARRVSIELTILCVMAAIAIIAAIRPRFERFAPPGIPLKDQDHPRLFEVIRQVAGQAAQSLPVDVYLVPEVNAFVSERGGFLGFGGRRIMGVGLPLLHALNCSQFVGVLAHEFGHFRGSDTKLGRWVFRTHSAMIRTLMNLQGSVIQKPFVWYAKLFLHITRAISRQQEYAADAFAVRIGGKNSFTEGLHKIHGIAPVYEAFWRNEITPILGSGYRPQIATGFQHFVSNPEIEKSIEEFIARREREEKSDPYDTHPGLPDRLAAIESLPTCGVPENIQPVISLLENANEQEVALLRFQFGAERTAGLRPIEWQEVGRKVYVPSWQNTARDYAEVLQNISIDRLPELISSPAFERLVAAWHERWMSPEGLDAASKHVLGAVLAQALAGQGWQINYMPGAGIELAHDGTAIAPFREASLWNGTKTTIHAWSSLCQNLKLAGAPVFPQG